MRRLVSVTTVLKPWGDFSFVKPEVLEASSEDGQEIHSLLTRHILCLAIFPEEFRGETEGYFNSGRRWADKHIKKVLLAEAELRDETQGYLGHPDLICVLKGDDADSLWDYKRAVPQKTHRPQVGGYKGLSDKAGFHVRRGGCIYLRADGRIPNIGKGEFTSTLNYDLDIFLACLKVFKFFRKEG